MLLELLSVLNKELKFLFFFLKLFLKKILVYRLRLRLLIGKFFEFLSLFGDEVLFVLIKYFHQPCHLFPVNCASIVNITV